MDWSEVGVYCDKIKGECNTQIEPRDKGLGFCPTLQATLLEEFCQRYRSSVKSVRLARLKSESQ